MSILILLLSSLWPSPPIGSEVPSAIEVDDGVRYRGIEALLARFEAEAVADPQNR
jgi:hypothetical protein